MDTQRLSQSSCGSMAPKHREGTAQNPPLSIGINLCDNRPGENLALGCPIQLCAFPVCPSLVSTSPLCPSLVCPLSLSPCCCPTPEYPHPNCPILLSLSLCPVPVSPPHCPIPLSHPAVPFRCPNPSVPIPLSPPAATGTQRGLGSPSGGHCGNSSLGTSLGPHWDPTGTSLGPCPVAPPSWDPLGSTARAAS